MVKKSLDLFSIWKLTVLFKESTGKTLSYVSLTSNFYYLQELDNMFLYCYGRAVMDQRFQFLAMVLKVLSEVLCLVCHDLFMLILYKKCLVHRWWNKYRDYVFVNYKHMKKEGIPSFNCKVCIRGQNKNHTVLSSYLNPISDEQKPQDMLHSVIVNLTKIKPKKCENLSTPHNSVAFEQPLAAINWSNHFVDDIISLLHHCGGIFTYL